ncbi:hypothetical protein [Sphingomonas swuensis]
MMMHFWEVRDIGFVIELPSASHSAGHSHSQPVFAELQRVEGN